MLAPILIGLVLGVLLLVIFLLFLFQEWMLYMPQVPNRWRVDPPPMNSLDQYKSPRNWRKKYEGLRIETEDGVTIFGWLIKTRGSGNDSPTIVFCHGNAGNMGFRLPFAMHVLEQLDCNILLFDYRGYGYSRKARITEKGLMLDLKAVIEHVVEKQIALGINGEKLVLMGRSLGGAVVLNTLAKYPGLADHFAGLVIENCFLSVRDVARDYVWESFEDEGIQNVCYFLLDLLLRMKWDNKRAIRKIDKPMLFLAGQKDKIVPPRQMRTLYAIVEASSSAYHHFETFPRGGHNTLPNQPDYFAKLERFVTKAVDSRISGRELPAEFPVVPSTFS